MSRIELGTVAVVVLLLVLGASLGNVWVVDVGEALFFVLTAWYGRLGLLAWGAGSTRALGSTLTALAVGVGVAFGSDLTQVGGSVHAVLQVAFLAGLAWLTCCWLAPNRVVGPLGGPTNAWLLLRERARLAFEANRLAASPDRGADQRLHADLQGLDRFRSPGTDELISLLVEWHAADPLATERENQIRTRISVLEVLLYRSLGTVPAWYRSYPWLDVSGRARAGRLIPLATGSGSPSGGD
jgi:hypothetical protein